MKLTVAALLLSAAAQAQSPAGWQVMKDRKQQCKIAVPPGWTADSLMPGSVTAPDKKASVIFSGKPAGATYAQISTMAKDMFKPAKVFEENGMRVWFASAPARGGSSWYVALNTSPVCDAQIEFKDPAFEATAKQMINSLNPAK